MGHRHLAGRRMVLLGQQEGLQQPLPEGAVG